MDAACVLGPTSTILGSAVHLKIPLGLVGIQAARCSSLLLGKERFAH